MFYTALALGLLVAVWQPVSMRISVGFIPTPIDVWHALVQDVQQSDTYLTILITLRRIVLSFVCAGLLGIALGMAMGLNKSTERFSLPYVVVAIAIPGPVYVIMSLLILGVNEWSSLAALIIAVTPFVTNIVFQGTAARDDRLDEMARHYRVRGWARMRHVIVPQIAPSILAGARTSFAMSWKLVVLMEALSRPDGVGAAMTHAFRLLRPAQVVAYTAIFVVIMYVIETFGFRPVERRLLRWRVRSIRVG